MTKDEEERHVYQFHHSLRDVDANRQFGTCKWCKKVLPMTSIAARCPEAPRITCAPAQLPKE